MDRCKSFKRYRGLRDPRCAGGEGCDACWARRNVIRQVVDAHKVNRDTAEGDAITGLAVAIELLLERVEELEGRGA